MITEIVAPAESKPAPIKSDWEVLCEVGRQAVKEMDEGRWILGDLANEIVVKKYGEDSLGQFAGDVGVGPQSMKEYRAMARFYKKETRASFLAEFPDLSYSHLRLAKQKFDILDDAFKFLVQCSTENASVAYAAVLAKLVKGEATSPARKTFAIDGVDRWDDQTITFKPNGIPERIMAFIHEHGDDPDFALELTLTYTAKKESKDVKKAQASPSADGTSGGAPTHPND